MPGKAGTELPSLSALLEVPPGARAPPYGQAGHLGMELGLPLPHGICAGWCWGTAVGCSRALWGRASAVPVGCHQLVLPVLPAQGPLVLWWQPGGCGGLGGDSAGHALRVSHGHAGPCERECLLFC